MSPLTVVIRANGSELIGLGHIRRCLTLAEALSTKGAKVHFVVNNSQAAIDTVTSNGFDVTAVEPETDFEQTRETIQRLGAKALVVDSYDIDANYLGRIRGERHLVVAVDDNADRRLPVDMVINGNVYGPSLNYDALPETALLRGAQYAILRKDFRGPISRQIEGPAKTVLITIGGSDPAHLTPKLVEMVFRVRPDIDVDVVVGPFFDKMDSLETVAPKREQIRLHYNPGDMRSLMVKADLAITGGGQTTYELAATGTPALAILTAENQRQNLGSLDTLGTLVFAGGRDDVDLMDKLSNGFTNLANDAERRADMSRRGRELIDALGAERLSDELIRKAN